LARPETPGLEPAVVVRELLVPEVGLGLRLVAGRAGLDHTVHLARVQRPGLALTGFTDYIRYGRVQIMGSSELGYLRTLPPGRRRAVLARLGRCRISCFIVTKGLTPPPELRAECQARGIPLLVTPTDSTAFIKQLSAFLDERLAQRMHLHAVLVDVFGLGVLIVGESGIGKSECALDLIDRGHRLVSDDVVEIKRKVDSLEGGSPELTRHHMELRGLGVINIKDLYGVSSIRPSKRIELVVSLERWEAGKEYDRLGLRDERYSILGLAVPLIRMPVAPGRNLTLLVEVAARNQLLKSRGYDAARRFAERVDQLIEDGGGPARSAGARPRGVQGGARGPASFRNAARSAARLSSSNAPRRMNRRGRGRKRSAPRAEPLLLSARAMSSEMTKTGRAVARRSRSRRRRRG
jgi:HPr kinase/phosphorylase